MKPSVFRKVYETGSRPDIRVPAREVALAGGNAPLRLYDTSGPFGPDGKAELEMGLPPLRAHWIHERGDVEETRREQGRPILRAQRGRRPLRCARIPA